MAKHTTLPDSTFEDDDQLAETRTVYVDDTSDSDVIDPDYDDARQPDYDNDFADPDADGGGSQEWYARKQK